MVAKDVAVRRRGKRLVGPLNLTFDAGGITVVLGPNGAGKTTLLKALHGLERLSGGEVTWGVPHSEAQAKQAYVFQTPIILRRSVRQNLAFPLGVIGMDKARVAKLVAKWADRIDLTDALDRPATRLSGGEKQKLALARALIGNPQVLFLDEPCTNLDGRSTREIEALLKAAHDTGTRIIMATHDLGQARRMASEVLFVLDGNIHESGSATACFDAPQTPALQAFLKGEIVE
jgi:tungstate transport system ATP-binding protein